MKCEGGLARSFSLARSLNQGSVQRDRKRASERGQYITPSVADLWPNKKGHGTNDQRWSQCLGVLPLQ